MKLPDSWIWTTVGEVTEHIRKVKPSENSGREFIYLDISSIDNSENRITSPKVYKGSEAPSRARQLIQVNDVLFSTVRTYLKNIALVPEVFDGQIASTGFSILRAKPVTTGKYLFYYSLTDAFIKSLSNIQRGTSYPAVRDSDVREQPIPLPPFAEQERIVARIEELFTQLEAGVASLQRVRATLKRYKASVLKAACEGRLVDGKQGIGEDELPEGWRWTKWQEISPRVTVGHVGKMKDEYIESGVPFLRGQNVRENRFDPEGLKYISPQFHKQISKSTLNPGDIVVVRSGSVGVSCVIPETLQEANCSDLVIIKKPSGMIPEFGAYYLNSLAKKYITEKKVGVALIHFNTRSVAQMPVPLPPLDEQRLIVAEVELRLSVAAQVEAAVEAGLKRAERLQQSILKRAFEGKLVDQNPNDEPASVLLARIKKERQLWEKEDKQQRKISRKRKKTQHTQIIQVESVKDLHELLLTLPGNKAETEQLWKESKLNIDKFYILLKEAINEGYIVEHREEFTVYLEASDEN